MDVDKSESKIEVLTSDKETGALVFSRSWQETMRRYFRHERLPGESDMDYLRRIKAVK